MTAIEWGELISGGTAIIACLFLCGWHIYDAFRYVFSMTDEDLDRYNEEEDYDYR